MVVLQKKTFCLHSFTQISERLVGRDNHVAIIPHPLFGLREISSCNRTHCTHLLSEAQLNGIGSACSLVFYTLEV